MSNYLDMLKNRRSIYSLGRNVSQSKEDLESLIKEIIRESPTAFNSQSTRAVILFGDAHEKVWDIVESSLRAIVPADNFASTEAKLNSFRAGFGTVLFFTDQANVTSLQENFPLYADNFPDWAEQAVGIAMTNVWTALSNESGLGGNVQHYNPLINEAVTKEWDLPSTWNLRAQLVFGSKEADAEVKEYMSDTDRFKTFD